MWENATTLTIHTDNAGMFRGLDRAYRVRVPCDIQSESENILVHITVDHRTPHRQFPSIELTRRFIDSYEEGISLEQFCMTNFYSPSLVRSSVREII